MSVFVVVEVMIVELIGKISHGASCFDQAWRLGAGICICKRFLELTLLRSPLFGVVQKIMIPPKL